MSKSSPALSAVIFDLDGVLTDTARLHFRSWQRIAGELDVPFDRTINDRLLGLSRTASLDIVLDTDATRFTSAEKAAIADRKNAEYLRLVNEMTPADILPGIPALLDELRARGVPIAVASSSRNAAVVLEHLGIADQFDAVVSGNDVERSKPAPDVFLAAAARLATPADRCVVIEDAESGVDGALAAGMRVIGVGPESRVGRAHVTVSCTSELTADLILGVSGVTAG